MPTSDLDGTEPSEFKVHSTLGLGAAARLLIALLASNLGDNFLPLGQISIPHETARIDYRGPGLCCSSEILPVTDHFNRPQANQLGS